MPEPDPRRVYYDHEPAWQKIARAGGRGWDDLVPSDDSYDALERFLRAGPVPPPGPGVRVLELGCGGGQVALRLARLGYQVAGADYAETAIELARGNAGDAGLVVDFRVDDCLTLASFEAGAFDLVVDNHALHCVVGEDDRTRFLAAARRVSRKGAIFFSDTMSSEGDFRPELVRADAVTRVAKNGTRFWTTRSELLAALARAGFETLHVDAAPPNPPGTGECLATWSRAV
jgi:2-polyprenyl-6-hydroxyphenyl methylase/3-demethylubiquinone-9 3-methyltransferase